MARDRVITYPADATQRLADRLQDDNWDLDGESATEIAQEIVIDVTEAVDRLRASEGAVLRDEVELAVTALLDLLPVSGSWGGGYRVNERVDGTVRALPEEWATAAHHVCRLHTLLIGQEDGASA